MTVPSPAVASTTASMVMALPSTGFGHDDWVRVVEARFRRRLLNGEHEADVKEAIIASFGLERESVMKWVDVAANSYVQLWTTLSALYSFPARVKGPADGSLANVIAAVEQCGHWARMPRTQRDILALREVFLLLSWDKDSATLQERIVTPDFFECPRPLAIDPTRIGQIAVYLRCGQHYQRHEYQIEDDAGKPAPLYRVTDHNGVEIADETRTGDAYPWKDGAGLPIIPGVLYHAAETGTLLDWRTGRDIARGAVRLMVFYTGLGHVIVDASWAQRYAFNVEFDGVETDKDGHQKVVMDPAIIATGSTRPGEANGQPIVGAFPQPADPEAVMRTIAMYARQLAASAGVRSPEATRTESDIRSGYSLAVSREAVQEMQAGYAPTFRRCDQQYMHVASCVMGTPSLGPADWTLAYQAIAMSPAELSGRLAVAKAARDACLMSRLDAMLFVYPWLTVEEAQAKIDSGELDVPVAEVAAKPMLLAPTDLASVITVDEVRLAQGLPPAVDGNLTVSQYQAKHAATVAAAANAAAGQPTP